MSERPDAHPSDTERDDAESRIDAALFHAFHADEDPVDLFPTIDGSPAAGDETVMPWVTLPDLGPPGPAAAVPEDEVVAQLEADGRYVVTGELGRGGMGVVLAGRDNKLGREVAIKVLHEIPGLSARRARRFVEEAQIAGQLEHPGIVPVHAIGVIGGKRPFFTMKYVRGETLGDVLDRRHDPAHDLPRLLDVFARLCEAVAYAHTRGVIHRDLKPANVMLGAFGEVLVMDWGLAKVLGETSPPEDEDEVTTLRSVSSGMTSRVGSVMGTPAYMSPEQARGEVEAVDQRSDVFALGAILCQILTGRTPYRGTSSAEIRKQAAEAALDAAAAWLAESGADGELIELARDCLAARAKDRPSDAAAVERRLEVYRASLDERARAAELRAVEARARAEHQRKVSRLVVAVAGLGLLAAAVVGSAWVVSVKRGQQTEARVAEAAKDALVLRERAQQATESEAESQWLKAYNASRRAADVAEAGRADAATIADCRRLVDEVRAEWEGARDAEERRRRDEAMIRRLDEAHGDQVHGLAIERDFPAAFREYGIPIDELGLEECVTRIRGSRIAGRLYAALHEWISARLSTRRLGGEPARSLIRFTRAVDPEPRRRELLSALHDRDCGRMQALVMKEDDGTVTAELYRTVIDEVGRKVGAKAAVTLYEHVLQRRPSAFWLNFGAGLWRSRLAPRDDEGAAFAFAVATGIRPGASVAWYNLGLCLARCGRLEEARVAQRRAIEIRPSTSAPARRALSGVLRAQHKYQAALDEVDEALRLAPDDPTTWRDRGDALFSLGRYAEALESYERYLDHNPRHPVVLRLAGVQYKHLRRYDEAEKMFRASVASDGGDAVSQYALGQLLATRGRWEEAIPHLERATELDRRHRDAWYNLGHCYARVHRHSDAIVAARHAVELEPDDVRACFNLGQFLRTVARFTEALPYLEHADELARGGQAIEFDTRVYVDSCRAEADDQRRLVGVLEGRLRPDDDEAWEELAIHTRRFQPGLIRARFWEVLLRLHGRADWPWLGPGRIDAAGAALAAANAAGIDAGAKARWQRLALSWLGQRLEQLDAGLESGDLPESRVLSEVRRCADLEALDAMCEGGGDAQIRATSRSLCDRIAELLDDLGP